MLLIIWKQMVLLNSSVYMVQQMSHLHACSQEVCTESHVVNHQAAYVKIHG